jgi:hypothetical protein
MEEMMIQCRLMIEGLEAFTKATREASVALDEYVRIWRLQRVWRLREKRMRLTVARHLHDWDMPIPLALWISRHVPSRVLPQITAVMEA